jgi:hypothetical protein
MAVVPSETTKLEAINDMLLAVAERPVAALGDTLTARQAEQLLTKVDRKVQTEGWYFNIERDVTLPMAGGEIPLAINIISVDTIGLPPVQKRGPRVYDMTAKSYEFTSDLTGCIVTYRRDWPELPQEARDYITARATREFYASVIGDGPTMQSLQADEFQSLAELKLKNDEQADYTGRMPEYWLRGEGGLGMRLGGSLR